jgi:hypothetical protein
MPPAPRLEHPTKPPFVPDTKRASVSSKRLRQGSDPMTDPLSFPGVAILECHLTRQRVRCGQRWDPRGIETGSTYAAEAADHDRG